MTSELEKEPSSLGIYVRFWWHRILALVLVGVVFFLMLMMSPDALSSKGRSLIAGSLDRRFASMQSRAPALSGGDRLLLRLALLLERRVGKYAQPESAAILAHALAGDDATLEIPARYFHRSPAVGKALARPAVRVTVSADPADEPRFSFGLSGATIDVKAVEGHTEYDLRRRIALDAAAETQSVIVLGRLALHVPDSLVATANPSCCKPFEVHAHWSDADTGD